MAGESIAAVGNGALQHLHRGDVPGASDARQRTSPTAHMVILGRGVEKDESTAADAGDGGQGLLMRVVHGRGAVGGVAGGDHLEGGGGAGQVQDAVLPGTGDGPGEPEGLTGTAAMGVAGDDRRPVDQGAAVPADRDERTGCRPQRDQGDGAEQSGGYHRHQQQR